MKRHQIFAIVVTVTVLMGMVLSASAALPGAGWWTSFQIQNVDADTATIAYTAYWQVGQGGAQSGTTYSQDGAITLASGAAVIYNPGLAPNYPSGNRIGFSTADKHLPSGFAGGVEISSDRDIRAVVQVGNNPAGSVGVTGGRASAFYQGTQGTDTGTSILFPTMKHNYFGQTTSFYIQAAGGAATINATFRVGASTYPLTNISIPAGKSYLLDPAAASVPSGSLGSLTVTATAGNVAGVVVETQHSANPGTFALSTKGFTPAESDPVVVVPTNKVGFFGGNTGWQLLNTTGVNASVAVTFTVTNIQPGSAAATAGMQIGDKFRANIQIGANGSYLFSPGQGTYQAATPLRSGGPALQNGVFFAGLAVSNQPLVATVNENNGPNRLVYSAFGASRATTKAAAPLVKEDFFGATTGLAVQNVGTAVTTVSLEYKCTNTSGQANTYTVSGHARNTIQPGAASSFIDLNNTGVWGSVRVPSGNQCAVTVTSTSQPVVAIAQESNPTVDTKNYEGFNLTP